jgi:predicted Zn-dependent protease
MDPKSPEPRAALARLFLSPDKKANTEEVLKQAKRDFPDEPAGYRLLADFHFTTGDMENATAEYGALYQEHPRNL